MIALLAALLAAATVCGLLGAWQLGRAEIRGATAEAERLADVEQRPATPLVDLLAPRAPFATELVGRRAQVTGAYEPGSGLVVPGRVREGVEGVLVLVGLRVDGTATPGEGDAILPVVRGWAPDEATARRFLVPAAGPPVRVDVMGFLQVAEGSGAGIDGGRTEAISAGELVNAWGGPIYTGYLVAQTETLVGGAGDLEVVEGGPVLRLPAPTLGGDAGLNIQNLGYALQWWLFGGFAVALWVRLVRDEQRGVRRGEGLLGAEPEGGLADPTGPRSTGDSP